VRVKVLDGFVDNELKARSQVLRFGGGSNTFYRGKCFYFYYGV